MKTKVIRASRASGKYDNIKRYKFLCMDIYEVKEKEVGTEKIFEDIVVEKVSRFQ